MAKPGKIAGKVSRSPGYTQPMLVTLEGLPKGYVAPQILVAVIRTSSSCRSVLRRPRPGS